MLPLQTVPLQISHLLLVILAGAMALVSATLSASDAIQSTVLPFILQAVCGGCRLYRFITEELLRLRRLLLLLLPLLRRLLLLLPLLLLLLLRLLRRLQLHLQYSLL